MPCSALGAKSSLTDRECETMHLLLTYGGNKFSRTKFLFAIDDIPTLTIQIGRRLTNEPVQPPFKSFKKSSKLKNANALGVKSNLTDMEFKRVHVLIT